MFFSRNDRKRPRKRPETTAKIGHPARGRGMDSSEIPRFSPHFPRFSVQISRYLNKIPYICIVFHFNRIIYKVWKKKIS